MKSGALNSKEINVSMRIDGSFHLSEGVVLERTILKHSHKPLIDFCSSIFTSGRSKRVYTKKEYGYPYLSNSDVIAQSPFDSCNHNSRKYGYDESAFLKEGMVLTGRVGAIGQTAYVTKEFEEKEAMGSDNIIRIVAKPSEYSGYIYSFLSSRVGNSLLWKLAAGGVQPYITDQMVKNIPVPIFPESKQKEIHNLIVESANLRVEANRLLEESICMFAQTQHCKDTSKTKSISSSTIKRDNRFSGNYFLSLGAHYEETIKKKPFIYLSECVKDIFTSGREKRNYSLNKQGIPFLSNTDLSNTNPFKGCNYVIRKSNERSTIKENMVLTGRVGQIGQVYFPHSYLVGCIASDNIIRIEVNETLEKEYIFAFLSSDMGTQMIKRRKTGVVQPFITEEMLSTIPILLLSRKEQEEIVNNVKKYSSLLKAALDIENQAISLVEKEIESWQQS